MLGERLMPDLVKLLDGPAVSYGNGAIVDVDGEMGHRGACVHPMLGKPMRAAISGGEAVIECADIAVSCPLRRAPCPEEPPQYCDSEPTSSPAGP